MSRAASRRHRQKIGSENNMPGKKHFRTIFQNIICSTAPVAPSQVPGAEETPVNLFLLRKMRFQTWSAPGTGAGARDAGLWTSKCWFTLFSFLKNKRPFIRMIECACVGHSMDEICSYTRAQNMPCHRIRRVGSFGQANLASQIVQSTFFLIRSACAWAGKGGTKTSETPKSGERKQWKTLFSQKSVPLFLGLLRGSHQRGV